MRRRLPEITRPNGRPYRPRMIDAKVYYLDEEPAGVYIFGTHDVAIAQGHALAILGALNETWYRHDLLTEYRFALGYPARQTWISLIPAGEPDELEKVYVRSETRGRAAVEFGIQEDLVIASDITPSHAKRRSALARVLPPALVGFPSF